MSTDKRYQRYLHQLAAETDARGERMAAAWRRILPFFDPLELRFLTLERREREEALHAELEELRARLRDNKQ